jgi:hypothetical protein
MLHIPLWIADILFALFVTALVETAIISALQLCLYFSFQRVVHGTDDSLSFCRWLFRTA